MGVTGISSTSWTGRPWWAGSPIDMLRRSVRNWLYPGYECECCVGQEAWQGCYCAYYGGIAPNIGPENWRVVARDLAKRWLGVRG